MSLLNKLLISFIIKSLYLNIASIPIFIATETTKNNTLTSPIVKLYELVALLHSQP